MGYFLAICVITLIFTLSKNAESKGVLNVTFVDYLNPGRQDYDGGCCDPFVFFTCDDCDTYFEICLQSTYVPVASQSNCTEFVRTRKHEGDNFNIIKTYGPNFGEHGERNPIEYHFDDTWQGMFSIYMKVYDDDGSHFLGVGSQRDLVDIASGKYQYLAAGAYSSNPITYPKTLTGSRTDKPTSTNIKLSLQCDRYYYDGYCTTYCKAQDSDAAGHYTCDSLGQKICRSGWYGTNCKTPFCKKDCKNGYCKKPGGCICSVNWTGKNCDKCIPKKGCRNGVCKNGGDCICLPEWSGTLCNQDMNSCRSQPCQNGAHCQNNGTSYYCQCAPGYHGNQCEKEIDLCASAPCMNNATCVNFRTDFKCNCPPGFNGRLCQINTDECLSNKCGNGANCTDGINTYSCVCQPGYSGQYCTNDVDECSSNPCMSHGICKDGINNYTCSCLDGFRGRRCEENINDCDRNPCEHNGNCTDGINDYTCSCVQGWVGKNCSSNGDQCVGQPCRNNGTCHESINDYNCSCVTGFTGKDCHININDCDPQPCQNNGICVDGVNSFNCICKPGFSGSLCAENIDDCKDDPCQNGGQCHDGINQYQCACSVGYAGRNCEIDINECSSLPCLNNATCVDKIGNFSCNCSLGYEGRQCENEINYCKNIMCKYGGVCVNELTGYHCECREGYNGTLCENTPCTWQPCQNNATCILNNNTIHGFKCDCSALNYDAYRYDGELCENDMNNCDPKYHHFDEGIGLTENGLCGFNGKCVDYVGYYKCVCSKGWRGVSCTIDINECATSPCRNGGECTENVTGPGYYCSCPSGYTGKNCEKMINLCEKNPCCQGAVCSYGLNSFSCNCTNGLKGPSCCSNSTWCSDDLFNVSTCYKHGKCTSLENRFDCSCDKGYAGSRCEIDINECDNNPCVHGECRNTHGSYECICHDDYNGTNCEQKIDDCKDVVCQNDGKCVDGVRNYTCECKGYTGRHCEIDIDECAVETECTKNDEHGVCHNTPGSYYCGCKLGYAGYPPNCRKRTESYYCKSFPCGNRGICANVHIYEPKILVINYTCNCFPGWEGRNCENVKKSCFCENGKCQVKSGQEICECNQGFKLVDAGDKCSPSPLETSKLKKKGSQPALIIATGFIAVVLCAVVMLSVLYLKKRRHLQRQRNEGSVRFNQQAAADNSLDPVPEPIMFKNPLFHINKGFHEEPELSNDFNSWKVSGC